MASCMKICAKNSCQLTEGQQVFLLGLQWRNSCQFSCRRQLSSCWFLCDRLKVMIHLLTKPSYLMVLVIWMYRTYLCLVQIIMYYIVIKSYCLPFFSSVISILLSAFVLVLVFILPLLLFLHSFYLDYSCKLFLLQKKIAADIVCACVCMSVHVCVCPCVCESTHVLTYRWKYVSFPADCE